MEKKSEKWGKGILSGINNFKREQALYVKSTRGATVKAETEVICVSLGREDLIKILGD